IDFSLAGVFGAVGYMAFSQKGVDGARIIANRLAGVRLENVTSTGQMAAIGVLPGLATSVSYAEAAYALRMMMVYLAKSLYRQPSTIFPVVLLMFAVGLSALGN